jgi:hypothetical protein
MDAPVQQRTQQSPIGEQLFREVTRDTFCIGFGVTMSGDISTSAQFGTILAAESGYRWGITAGAFHAVVRTTLNGAGVIARLHLNDGTSTAVVAPLGSYLNTAVAGTIICGTEQLLAIDFGPLGFRSSAAGNGLFIRGNETLGAAGQLLVTGWVRGWKESGSP